MTPGDGSGTVQTMYSPAIIERVAADRRQRLLDRAEHHRVLGGARSPLPASSSHRPAPPRGDLDHVPGAPAGIAAERTAGPASTRTGAALPEAVTSGPTMLGVWAHPDDEAYMTAGLMAAVRRAGFRVVVLVMTAGERGTADPARWPPDRLGALRRHELRASLAALDVTEHHVIGLPDGGCERFDATPLVVAVIERLSPTMIVTFGPDGFTGHPDHRAVSRWTTRAWRATGRRAALWYATVTPSFHADHGHLNRAVDLWSMQPGGTAPWDPVDSLAHQVHLRGSDLDQKIAALRAHASQTTAMISKVGERSYRDWWSTESFRAAPSGRVAAGEPTSDVLAMA